MHHIEAYNNKNKPIVDIDNDRVPLVYFNHIKLNKGEIVFKDVNFSYLKDAEQKTLEQCNKWEKEYIIEKVGVFTPKAKDTNELSTGEIGFITTGINFSSC